MPTITGTSGPNILSGDIEWREDLQEYVSTPTVDEIFGLAGDDIIDGYFLGDTLWGDEGDDIVRGGDGNDTLHGGPGNDILQGDGYAAGDTGTDFLAGDEGNDYLNGGDGWDYLFGGEGDDELFGNAAYPEGTDGNFLDGGPGNDRLVGTSGANMMFGGDGIDTASLYFLDATEPVDFVALEPGGGYAPMVGGMPYAHVSGIEIFAQLWGGKANDRLGAAYTLPEGAQYTLSGQGGEDTAVLDFSAETGRMAGSSDSSLGWLYLGNLDTGGQLQVSAEHVHYNGNALGGIYLGDGNDILTGLAGNDTFGGGGGDDLIDGAAGADTLYGGEGDDSITGGTGADWIDGQTGTDTAVYAGSFAEYSFSPQADRLRVTSKAGDTDQLFGIERLRFDDGEVAVRPDFNIDSTAFTFTTGTLSQAEGTGGTPAFSFTVTRAGATGLAQSIPWSLAGIAGSGTMPATAADFPGGAFPTGLLSFAPGQTSATIVVPVAADAAVETNERFAVTLGAPPPASVVTKGTAQGIILNDDATIGIAGLAYNLAEGTGGSTGFTFTLTRSGATGGAATVNYAVSGATGSGTTPAGAADFAGGAFPAGTVSFAPGQTSRTLTIPVAADDLLEFNERFAVTLSGASGATIGTASAQGIISNDDVAPPPASFAIARLAASRTEGSSGGTTPFTFTVTRGGNTAVAHSIAYAVAGVAGNGTMPAAAADFDGATLPAGRLTFAPGETSRVLTIPVAADLAGELNERFAVTLSAPSAGAVLGGTVSAEGVILNDDTSLAFTSTNVSRPEGNAGTTAYSFTVSRAGTTSAATTVDWSFAGGGVAGTVAANAADFAGGLPSGGTLSFAPGQTTRTITIPVLGDTNPEGGFNESFTLSLANASSGVSILGAKATGTIREDDAITGTTGNDTLFGTVGADLFVIGQGQDTIWGGNGVDSFRFLPSAAAPANLFTLNDFDPFVAERIDLSRIDAIAGTLANDAFTFIGPMPLTLPGQLHWERLSPHLVEFQGNLNADPAPELRFVLFSPGTPDSTWFVL
jgi:Ca2+-binding RTX toxin-like protein